MKHEKYAADLQELINKGPGTHRLYASEWSDLADILLLKLPGFIVTRKDRTKHYAQIIEEACHRLSLSVV